MARILILREEGEAARRTARLIAAMGDEPVHLPIQTVRRLTPDLPPGPFAAILVTSANAAPFLQGRAIAAPILTVGAASRAALAEAGHAAEIAGAGTGEGLAERAIELHRADGRPVLYLAGRVRTDGLERALAAAAVPFEVVDVYDTVPREPALDLELAFGSAPPDAVLLLSLGQARGYGRLLSRLPRMPSPEPRLLCLSARIRDALPPDLRDDAIVAERPALDRLLEAYASERRRDA